MKATQVCIIAVLLASSQIAIARPSGIAWFDGLVSFFAPRSHAEVQALNRTDVTTDSPLPTTSLAPGNTTVPSNSTQPPGNTTVPSNSTQPPGKFKCTAEGQFPDPQNCKAYHVCVFVPADGGFQDNSLSCPAPLIYCQAEQVCVFEGYNGCEC